MIDQQILIYLAFVIDVKIIFADYSENPMCDSKIDSAKFDKRQINEKLGNRSPFVNDLLMGSINLRM